MTDITSFLLVYWYIYTRYPLRSPHPFLFIICSYLPTFVASGCSITYGVHTTHICLLGYLCHCSAPLLLVTRY